MWVWELEQGISTETFLSLKDEVLEEHREALLMMQSDYITSTKRFLRKSKITVTTRPSPNPNLPLPPHQTLVPFVNGPSNIVVPFVYIICFMYCVIVC